MAIAGFEVRLFILRIKIFLEQNLKKKKNLPCCHVSQIELVNFQTQQTKTKKKSRVNCETLLNKLNKTASITLKKNITLHMAYIVYNIYVLTPRRGFSNC